MCADDFCDIFTPRLPGRSTEIEMRIVGEDELHRQNEENLAEVQKELAQLRKIEDEVQKLLDDLPKDGKVDDKAVDQLIDLTQKAKQVQERIGLKSNEGIRDKLEKMQDSIKDNKLDNPELQDQVRGLNQELQRLVQEEFPKLEQQLNESRKEMTGTKKDDKQKSPLDKAKSTNKEIQKSLNELSKSLDRWADLAQIKGQMREWIEKQKNLTKETEGHNEKAELGEKVPAAQKMLDEERSQLAKQQSQLDKEAMELMNKITQVKKQKDDTRRAEGQKAEDPERDASERAESKQKADEAADASKKLDAARSIAGEEKLADHVREAAKSLDEKKLNDAVQKQKNATKTAQKMLAAMDGKKDDDFDRLKKKDRSVAKVQEGLDKLGKNLDKQQQARNQPNAKVDPNQQAKDLRKEAEELRELARQLMRLQEPKAARELQQAADALDEAAKKAEAGQPTDDEEKMAQERIEQANQDLEHLRQELAREQLVKIEGRLKGLKERQDAAVERTKELHTKLLQRKQWSRGLIQSLDGDQQSQAGLAKETQSLEEKLKGAMVFEHILKKAGKSMEQASDAMAKRKEVAKERQLAELDKEERDDENRRQEDILKLQKQAADRLDRLLDAMKDAQPQAVAKNEPKQEQPKEDAKKDEKKEPQNGLQAQDGIPPMAQIKALKAEQVDLHEQTKEFARRNPNLDNLNEDQRRELRDLTDEQGRLRQLFEQMTAPRDEKGGQP
jgi:hypothetical protein